MILENGVHRAIVKDVNLYLRGENERLTAAFKVECEGKELVHREWVELNDGTISDKTIKRLRACFPSWDGSLETLEQGFCVKDVEVDVLVENEQDKEDPAKWWTRTKSIVPPGDSGGYGGQASMPEKMSHATLVSKYGARFRAMAGGAPARPATAAPAASPVPKGPAGQVAPAPAPRSGPPPAPVKAKPHSTGSGQASTVPSTLEECWEALCKKHPDELREQVGDRWFAILAQTVPEKDQADFTPEDWGNVLATVSLPF